MPACAPLVYSLCHLQQAAGAVPGSVQAGHGGLHLLIHHDAAALHGGPDLAGQRSAARHAQRHEHTGQGNLLPVGQLHPVTTGSPRTASTFCGYTVTSGGNSAVSGMPLVSRLTLFHHRQQGLHLVQGIGSAAQHGHILAAVEKGVADGTPAHAVALQPGKARNARHRTGGPVARITASAG